MLDRDKIHVCTHFDRSKQGVNQFFIKIKLRESDLLHLSKLWLRMLVAKRFCTRALYTELLVEVLVIVFLFFFFCLSFLPPFLCLFLIFYFSILIVFLSLWDETLFIYCLVCESLGQVEDKIHPDISISPAYSKKIVMSVKRKMKEKEFSNFLNVSFISQSPISTRCYWTCLLGIENFRVFGVFPDVSFLFFLSQKRKHNFLLENSPIKWIFRKCSWIFYSLFLYLSNYLCMAFFFSVYKDISTYVCII